MFLKGFGQEWKYILFMDVEIKDIPEDRLDRLVWILLKVKYNIYQLLR